MLKQNFNTSRAADTALAASRQVWLAGLGAAMVTRDWARNDAGHVFRALVREGSSVEARAIRVMRKRIDWSVAVASDALTKAKATAVTTVNGVVKNAVAAFPKLKTPAASIQRSGKTNPAKRSARKSRRAAKRAARKA